MADEATQSERYALRCPECGGEVVVRRLEVEDEKGRETVFLFNCKNGDFSVGATAAMVDEIVAETILSRLGEQRRATKPGVHSVLKLYSSGKPLEHRHQMLTVAL